MAAPVSWIAALLRGYVDWHTPIPVRREDRRNWVPVYHFSHSRRVSYGSYECDAMAPDFQLLDGLTWATYPEFKTMPFDTYCTHIDEACVELWGATWADLCGDLEPLQRAHANGETPYEFAEYWGAKYNLDPKSTW